jgi:hypothetical protein
LGYSTCIVPLVLLIVAAIWVRRILASLFAGPLPRFHQHKFVQILRDMVFKDPPAIMVRPSGPDGRHLFKGCGGTPPGRWRGRQHSFRACPMTAAGASSCCAKPKSTAIPLQKTDKSGELEVFRCRTSLEELMVLVRLPETMVAGEALFVAIVLPDLDSLRHDPATARKVTTFFVLSRWNGDLETDLTGWTAAGEQRYYNCGAPLDPADLARVLDTKVRRDWHIEKKPAD